jgi:hypothetical protein
MRKERRALPEGGGEVSVGVQVREAEGLPPGICGSTARQGLTPVYSSAQYKPLLWDALGGFRVSVTNTTQVELISGRVEGPTARRRPRPH